MIKNIKIKNIPQMLLLFLYVLYLIYKITISPPNYDAMPLHSVVFIGAYFLLNKIKNKDAYLSMFLLLVVMFLVGVPLEVIVAMLVLFSGILILSNSVYISIVLYTISFALVTALFASLFMDMDSKKTYYNAGTKYSLESRKYQSNIDDVINMPHGDMVTLDRRAKYLSVPREQKFITDNRGFRNDGDNIDHNLVIVGDSFVAGSNNSQEHTISNIIYRKYGIKPYNLGFPGNVSIYKKKMKEYLKDYPEAKFIMYVYEGNDFSKKIGWNYRLFGYAASNVTRVQNRIVKLTPYKFDDILFNKLKVAVAGSQISVHKIGNQDIGFYDKYTAVSKLSDPTISNSPGDDDSVLEHLVCAFYIPTKYTVYKKYITNSSDSYIEEHDPKYMLLKKYLSKYDVSVTNLTHELQREAERLLNNDQYVFWQDDTHWNHHGMEAVSESLFKCLK
jgi:hypothetical protein